MTKIILFALGWLALAAVTCWCIRRLSTHRRPEFPPMRHPERLHHSTNRQPEDEVWPIDWDAMKARRV